MEQPYIETRRVVIDRKYNPNYGDDKICECGHTYYRHFDSYEDMYACGCKYCPCYEFKLKLNEINYIVRVNEQFGGYKKYECETKEDVYDKIGRGWQYEVTSPNGKDTSEFIPF